MNRTIRHISPPKNILLLFLILASFSFKAAAAPKEQKWKSIERLASGKKDTTGIGRSLEHLNARFQEERSPELLSLLLRASRQEDRLDKRSQKTLYYLIRNFYAENKIKHFEYSLKISRVLSETDDYEGQLWILIDIGNIFFSEQDYQQARVYYRKAETAARKARSGYGLSIIYLNYGMIDERQKDYSRSLRNYRTSSRYRLESGNVKVVASTYVKMALVSLNLNRPDSCLHYLHLTEDYYLHRGEATDLLNNLPFYIDYVYAEYHLRQNDFDRAIAYIGKAVAFSKSQGLTGELIAGNAYETSFLFKAGRYAEAAQKAGELLPLFRQYNLLEQQKYAYRMLKKCYSKLGKYREADEASRRYLQIDDSLYKHHIRSELNMLRSIAAVYESESRLHHIRKNLQVARMHNNIRVMQRNTSLLIAISSMLGVLILAGLIVNSRRNKSKQLSLHNELIRQNNRIKLNSATLKRSNQVKDNLFSIIENDLRHPLYKLLEELHAVRDKLPEKQLTASIENTLKETITLFEGLLEWSKTGRKQNIYSPVKVGLDENINKIILFYLPEIQAREIRIINKSAAVATFADQNIVQTLLRNLLGNAIAAVAGSVGEKVIEIETRPCGDDQVEILFLDSGPGFPDEILEQFKDEQFDLHMKNQGLGLSICKALARMSGWTMELDNGGKLHGASVRIVVPLFRETLSIAATGMLSQIPETLKTALYPLTTFRFYQTSEIRSFLRSIGEVEDPGMREWIRQLERSVHEGNGQMYEALIEDLRPENQQIQMTD